MMNDNSSCSGYKREESTSFCEQKEAKKLYALSDWGVSNTARSGAEKFFGSGAPMTERSEV
jgi:hypothetical protein